MTGAAGTHPETAADRVILARPKKLRIITESTRKSDKLDTQVCWRSF